MSRTVLHWDALVTEPAWSSYPNLELLSSAWDFGNLSNRMWPKKKQQRWNRFKMEVGYRSVLMHRWAALSEIKGAVKYWIMLLLLEGKKNNCYAILHRCSHRFLFGLLFVVLYNVVLMGVWTLNILWGKACILAPPWIVLFPLATVN